MLLNKNAIFIIYILTSVKNPTFNFNNVLVNVYAQV